MKNNPIKELQSFGQSIWLDYIRRDLFTSGKLQSLIRDDGLRGMTSNPSLFEKAISDSDLYDRDIKKLFSEGKGLDRYHTVAKAYICGIQKFIEKEMHIAY
jgi:transaldolase